MTIILALLLSLWAFAASAYSHGNAAGAPLHADGARFDRSRAHEVLAFTGASAASTFFGLIGLGIQVTAYPTGAPIYSRPGPPLIALAACLA